jgi:elongation factor P
MVSDKEGRRTVARAVQIKKGNVIQWRDDLWKVLDTQQTFIGKRGAYIQMKLQHLGDGHVEGERFASDQEVEKAFLEGRRMQYLYHDGSGYVFMDPADGEQVHIDEALLKDQLPYLSYNAEVDMQLHEGRPVSAELPSSVVLEVTHTQPAIRGDTATAVTKPAEVETGLVVKVPGHVKTGDKIQVDTRTGEFLGRA